MRRDEFANSSGRHSRIRAFKREIMQLRQVDNHTNLAVPGARVCVPSLVVIGGAVVFAEYRAAWGLAWSWNVPVFAAAIILIGAIQHRLAGLGHESSHYSFMKNRYLNDLIPDLFCMFPLMTTIHFYRLFHMGHHQYTNDPDRDPDLQNLGHGKRADEFPMTRGRFIRVIYFALLVAPIRFLEYQWAYFKVNTLGKGRNVYVDGDERNRAGSPRSVPRLATVLGIAYIVGFNVVTWIPDRYRDARDGCSRRGCWGSCCSPCVIHSAARMGGLQLAVPPGVFAAARGRDPAELLHDPARGALATPVGHRRPIGRLLRAALAGAADHVVHVLHVPAGRLPALQRRRRAG